MVAAGVRPRSGESDKDTSKIYDDGPNLFVTVTTSDVEQYIAGDRTPTTSQIENPSQIGCGIIDRRRPNDLVFRYLDLQILC